jgi:hypothetical protein
MPTTLCSAVVLLVIREPTMKDLIQIPLPNTSGIFEQKTWPRAHDGRRHRHFGVFGFCMSM